jgi:hypothetical protein
MWYFALNWWATSAESLDSQFLVYVNIKELNYRMRHMKGTPIINFSTKANGSDIRGMVAGSTQMWRSMQFGTLGTF